MDLKERFVNIIERTGNPMAPVIIQDAARACHQVGKLMIGLTDITKAKDITSRLLKDFGEDIETISSTPEFIIALAGCLRTSLAEFVATIHKPK